MVNSLERGMLGTNRANRGILAKVHLIFYKKNYANAFYLVNVDLLRQKVFASMFLVLHQL